LTVVKIKFYLYIFTFPFLLPNSFLSVPSVPKCDCDVVEDDILAVLEQHIWVGSPWRRYTLRVQVVVCAVAGGGGEGGVGRGGNGGCGAGRWNSIGSSPHRHHWRVTHGI
jgi:hypothetical protein